MIDEADVLRDFLVARPTLIPLVGTRVWAELTYPPKGYKPSDGEAIVFKARTGAADSTNALLRTSWQFKFYGATVPAAHLVYRTTADILFDATLSGASFQSAIEVGGQSIPEPETGWPVVLAFFETWMYSGLPTFTPS